MRGLASLASLGSLASLASLAALVALAFAANGCGASSPSAVTPAPSASSQASGGPSGSSAGAPAASATAPKVRVREGELVFLEVDDGPGFLMDGNAPPPPPGSAPARHPFVAARCFGGSPALCSKARDLLLASKSYAEFLGRLRDAGFVVEAR